MNQHRIGTSYRPHTTLRRLLVHPKDKIEKQKTCGVVYKVKCNNCEKVYIGETGRKLETRIQEHRKDVETAEQGVRTRRSRSETSQEQNKSAITDHTVSQNHVPNWTDIEVLDKEQDYTKRQIKEAIWIRRNITINRDEGAYNLSHVYDCLTAFSRPRIPRGPPQGPGRSLEHR